MPTASKTQRWVDLLAALLSRHYPTSFELLAKDVPAYQDPKQRGDARMRMFERDKDELRKIGVPIETVEIEKGDKQYKLASRDFYLPRIGVKKSTAVRAAPARSGKPALPPDVVFEPDELAMIARAAERIQAMKHPVLAADATSALRKLAFDVPFMDRGVRELILLPFGAQDPLVLELLDDAVRRRKTLQFHYHSIERDARARRTVAPYGLVFLRGHWYLWAHDEGAQAIRQFRVSRITKPVVNPKNKQKPDFEVPPDFDLWEQSASRHAWELGDDDAVDVVVQFDPTDGHAAGGAVLGAAVRGDKNARRFVVRRSGPFVRWLLSFAGAARPVGPKAIVKSWRNMARQTAALYAARSAEGRE